MILLSTYTVILCLVKVFMLPIPCSTKQSSETVITTLEFEDNTGFQEEPSNYCHMNLSIEDTIKAKETFEDEMLKDENNFAFYIYLSKPSTITNDELEKYMTNDNDKNKWNGLQEWFWVKEEMKYYTLNLPIDLDALTFTISKYGTQNIDIRWTLGLTCHEDNKISYKNETPVILNYIWTNVIGNKSKSYICHRNFDNDTNYLETIWWVTTVWVGYDFNCYKINSLKKGILESVLISKNDMTKMLAIAICFVGYMHPFIWYIFESIQIRKEREIFRYYEDVIDSEKPYGLVRGMRKFLYPDKSKTYNENNKDQSDNTTAAYKGDRKNNTSTEKPDNQSNSALSDNSEHPENVVNTIEGERENNSVKQRKNTETNKSKDVSTGQKESAPTNESLKNNTRVPESALTNKVSDINTRRSENAPTNESLDARVNVPSNELTDVKEYHPSTDTGRSESAQTSEVLDVSEYAPFYRFSIIITLIIFSMHLYKLTDVKNEMFKTNGYSNFPKVFRFGIPEYNYIIGYNRMLPYFYIIISAIVYCISNSWIYKLYNDSEDFIICIPNDIFYGKWVVKTATIFPTMKEKDDLYSFRAGQKLIFRFTMLFSIRFWRFLFTYSMCGSSICCFNESRWTCIFYTIYKLFSVPLLITINVLINTIFCTFPALWFIIFIILRIFGIGEPARNFPDTYSSKGCTLVFSFLLYILYLLTLRQQVAFFIFIIRCFFYVIIVGFIGPERVWRIYITGVASVTYFLSYMNDFVNSYKVLLEVIFRESGFDFVDESNFNYIIDHCYSVKKRVFFVVVKTTLTIVFLVVTLLILRETGKLDNSKYLNDFVSYLMILISPKIVSIFSQSSPKEDIQKHKDEIKTLISVFIEEKLETVNAEYKGDFCWQKFKSICTCNSDESRESDSVESLNCDSSKWYKVLNAVFCQWHLTNDQSEILSFDGKINEVGRCSTCCQDSNYDEINSQQHWGQYRTRSPITVV